MLDGADVPEEKYYKQGVITDLMTEMGYKSSENGVCAGIAMMAVQADRTDKLDEFIDRLRLIRDTVDLKKEIDQAKEKNKLHSPLTPLEKKYLEIPAFFEGIELYYQPEVYREFIGQSVSQSEVFIEKISLVAASAAVEKEKGIVRAGNTVGIYEDAQLKKQIKSVGDLLVKNSSVSITLGSSDHRVTLLKSKDGRLFLIDPNKLPLQRIQPAKLLDSVYSVLFQGGETAVVKKATGDPVNASGDKETEEKNNQMFFVDIFSTGNISSKQEEAIKQDIQLLQLSNPIRVIAQNKMPNDATMMHVAAMTGNVALSVAIKEMLLQKRIIE